MASVRTSTLIDSDGTAYASEQRASSGTVATLACLDSDAKTKGFQG